MQKALWWLSVAKEDSDVLQEIQGVFEFLFCLTLSCFFFFGGNVAGRGGQFGLTHSATEKWRLSEIY